MGSWLGKLKDVYTVEDLAEFFDLPDFPKVEDDSQEYIFSAYGAVLREGGTEEEAMEAESVLRDEVYVSWVNAVESVAEKLFGEHNLDLDETRQDSHEFRVKPRKSWRDSANAIRETINGVGYFHFSSLKEFLDSGPYTARAAVLSHLHWVKRHPDVYGGSSPQRLYEQAWR